MAYVHIDIDLDEVELSELISAIKYRMDAKWQTAAKEVQSNTKSLTELYTLLGSKLKKEVIIDNVIIPKSLDEQIRYDHICKVFNKYTTAEIEKALPI